MLTIKREPGNIKTSDLKNYNKYFNQMTFKGIMEDDNIFNIDQNSFRDSKNIYVDDCDRLVSRKTLQYDDVPDNIIVYGYDLIEVKQTGAGMIYITKSHDEEKYIIVFNSKDGSIYSLQDLPNYQISIIEHYIICFNSNGAKVFDTNNQSAEWQDFNNFVEVPIIKNVVGTTITDLPKNLFTESYKENYVWSAESKPLLPANDANVKVINSQGSFEYSLNTDKNNDYRIINKIESTSAIAGSFRHITSAKGILCISSTYYFQISFDGGLSYKTIYYPTYEGSLINIASISEDGQYYFFVTTKAVYRCNLGEDFKWADPITVQNRPLSDSTIMSDEVYWPDESLEIPILPYCFKTGDIFAFMTNYGPAITLYFKGPGLYMGNKLSDMTKDNTLSYIVTCNNYEEPTTSGRGLYQIFAHESYRNYNNAKAMNITLTRDINNKEAAAITVIKNADYPDVNHSILYIQGGANNLQSSTTSYEMYSTYISLNTNDNIPNKSAIQFTNILNCTQLSDFTTSSTNKFQFGIECEVISNYSQNNCIQWRLSTLQIACMLDNNNQPIHDYTVKITKYLPLQNYIAVTDYNLFGKGEYTQEYTGEVPKRLDGGYLFTYNNIYLVCNSESINPSYESPEPTGWSVINYLSNSFNNSTYTFGDNYYIVSSYLDDTIQGQKLIITSNILDMRTIANITYTYNATSKFTRVPKLSYSDTELYLAFDNLLQITQNNREDTKILFNLPEINNQSFIDNITNMINISTTEVALFFEDKIVICSKVTDENLVAGYRYDYYNTKLSTGVRLGDSVINTLEGSYTIFPTRRGLAVMNYQAFMATSDQVIEYITDNIKDLWIKFFDESRTIKIMQWRNRLVLTNETNDILLYDLSNTAWWRWEVPTNPKMAFTDLVDLKLVDSTVLIFKEAAQYYDFGEVGQFIPINWFIQSQPLHMNAPNYYKNIKQLVFQFVEIEDTERVLQKSLLAQIRLYRKRITDRVPETVQFKIENLRTFVKRFNYWKIHELQWGLANDTETNTPARFELNGISIKYELGDEVR